MLTVKRDGVRSTVSFYLPQEVVERDELPLTSAFYVVEAEAAGKKAKPLLSTNLRGAANAKALEGFKNLAEQGVAETAGILRNHTQAGFDGMKHPTLIREDGL